MRIALVITALGAGGAERILIGMANQWAAEGAAVTLITFEPPGTKPYYRVDPRVELRQLDLEAVRRPRWRAAWQSVEQILALRRALRACQPDVAIAFLAKVNVISVLATRGLRLPLIVSERNNPLQQRFNPRAGSGCAIASIAGPTASSPRARGCCAAFRDGCARAAGSIPNPVDLPASTPARAASRKLVAVGRLVPQKGFDLLLQAFARIATAHPEWRLVIWGEGPERDALKELREKLGLRRRVDLPGLTQRPGQWTDDAGLFVLSSRFESFGNVITEAMASALPVVAFDCPWGPREILRDQVEGVLVPQGDVAALAAALDRLLADPARRAALGAAARQGARRFDRARVMAAWQEAIVAATSGNRSRPQGDPLAARPGLR